MKEEIEIKVPKNWSKITLKQYLQLRKDLDVYGGEEMGYLATLMYHLCGVEPGIIPKLPMDIIQSIQKDFAGFLSNNDLPLKRTFHLDGVEWGIQPNLSTMPYGMYLDITKFDTVSVDDNWVKIMNILYRPVVRKSVGMYDIKPYTGEDNTKTLINTPMDVVWGTYFFFLHTSMDLTQSILNSLREEETETLPNTLSDLVKNGEDISQLLNLQEVISPKLILSLKNL
jgi:hypothetical protein